MSGLDLFHQGGFIMYPLLIFSVLAWSIGIYKILALRSFRAEFERVNTEVLRALGTSRMEEVKSAFQGASSTIVRPLDAIVNSAHADKEELYERLGRRLTETNSELKKYLWVLGSITSSAPFVGLFGTVVGIMGSFKAIGASGKSGFSIVAAGISESLIATAAGIGVAVVALLFYNYLQTLVNATSQDFRLKMEEVADLLFTAKKGK